MSSTPFAYPQVVSGRFALVRVVKSSVSAARFLRRVRFPAASLQKVQFDPQRRSYGVIDVQIAMARQEPGAGLE
jgi:hypothetical protein